MIDNKIKIAVFYYSQSGQACNVAQRLFCSEKVPETSCQVIYKQIIPTQTYPFPWSKYEFFDTFPETRLYNPPSGIKAIELDDVNDADLVVVVGQSWFLSPSLPLQSFFADKDIKDYLHNRNVVFVNVCRNMWLKTIEWLKIYTKRIGAHLVGHIVLQDKAPNLISAVTIVRWLICGKKEASHIMPRAGVSTKDIHDSRRFGEIIYQTLSLGDLQNLQSRLLSVGAIDYRPFILHIEKIGFRMFGFWAKYIKRKGDFRDVRRKNRVYAFYYYLIVALFIVSPIVELFYYITYPLQKNKKYKEEYCRI